MALAPPDWPLVSPSPGIPDPHASPTLRAPPSVSYLTNPFLVGHPSQGAHTISKPANPSQKQGTPGTGQMGPAGPFLGGCDSISSICTAARMGCGSPRFLFVKQSPTFSLEVTFFGWGGSGVPRPPAERRRGAAGRGNPGRRGGAGLSAPRAIPALITCWPAAGRRGALSASSAPGTPPRGAPAARPSGTRFLGSSRTLRSVRYMSAGALPLPPAAPIGEVMQTRERNPSSARHSPARLSKLHGIPDPLPPVTPLAGRRNPPRAGYRGVWGC